MLTVIIKTVNDIFRGWRDLWPGGLSDSNYSTLNLMAHCREGALGYNLAHCQNCHRQQWYASSCGDRHCPNCLGPRQMEWSEKICERLPDCPHFHVVFTVPTQFHEFFRLNYAVATAEFFGAVTETIKQFQKNNWKIDGGFFGVLHTWGSALNWHPHIHCLVSSGGADRSTGRWSEARRDYSFPVRAMSRVFAAIMCRRLEALDCDRSIHWPTELDTLEARRDWRVALYGQGWNIFSRATLGNTRAVVRYLARYTSRIAMSNQRIESIDEEERTVSFTVKDYRQNGAKKTMTLSGKEFIHRFSQHLVPRGLRRVRYYGYLARKGKFAKIDGAPETCLRERAAAPEKRSCEQCGSNDWRFAALFLPEVMVALVNRCHSTGNSFSLVQPRAAP